MISSDDGDLEEIDRMLASFSPDKDLLGISRKNNADTKQISEDLPHSAEMMGGNNLLDASIEDIDPQEEIDSDSDNISNEETPVLEDLSENLKDPLLEESSIDTNVLEDLFKPVRKKVVYNKLPFPEDKQILGNSDINSSDINSGDLDIDDFENSNTSYIDEVDEIYENELVPDSGEAADDEGRVEKTKYEKLDFKQDESKKQLFTKKISNLKDSLPNLNRIKPLHVFTLMTVMVSLLFFGLKAKRGEFLEPQNRLSPENEPEVIFPLSNSPAINQPSGDDSQSKILKVDRIVSECSNADSKPENILNPDRSTAWTCNRDLGIDGQIFEIYFSKKVTLKKIFIVPGFDFIEPSGQDHWKESRKVSRILWKFGSTQIVMTVQISREGFIWELPQPVSVTNITGTVIETRSFDDDTGREVSLKNRSLSSSQSRFSIGELRFYGK